MNRKGRFRWVTSGVNSFQVLKPIFFQVNDLLLNKWDLGRGLKEEWSWWRGEGGCWWDVGVCNCSVAGIVKDVGMALLVVWSCQAKLSAPVQLEPKPTCSGICLSLCWCSYLFLRRCEHFLDGKSCVQTFVNNWKQIILNLEVLIEFMWRTKRKKCLKNLYLTKSNDKVNTRKKFHKIEIWTCQLNWFERWKGNSFWKIFIDKVNAHKKYL